MRPALILAFLFACGGSASAQSFAVVQTFIADVRASSGSLPTSHDYDPLQETQLLYNEPVHIVREHGEWMHIEAIEQPEYSHRQTWEGYPGWVRKDALYPVRKIPSYNYVVWRKVARLYQKPDVRTPSISVPLGAKLVADEKAKDGFRRVKTARDETGWMLQSDLLSLKYTLPEVSARKKLIECAQQFVGDLYFWGGRSAHTPEAEGRITAVDCSGFSNLLYRVVGVDIPRDSLEQFMNCKRLKRSQIQAGDLMFIAAADQPKKVKHVAVVLDSERLIEAPKTGETVRVVSIAEKLGVSLDQVEDGQIAGDRMVYFGTYFFDHRKY